MSDFRQRIEKLSPKRLALLALELQSRLEENERERTSPIAIVGIGCRMPGAAPGPQAFWNLLADGRDAISETPSDRWDVAAYYDPDPDAPGRMSTKLGSFLPNVDLFDGPFFFIARREAVSMDPQQRLLLEVCWEALENAGYSPRKFSGTSTGVFVGICSSDYHGMLLARGEEAIDAYLASGTAPSIAAGRISYTLGLQGPSLSVDTACSASLVAVHLACQSLRLRECRSALAGGVNLTLSPETTIALSKAHMMAADGRCKAFDSRADGFVRGEGCGIVVLKRLSDAVADADNILAVIRGSAVNQDGRSSGLTAPNGKAQEALIRQALANGGVRPDEIGYVEAHGTGTSLGDPIEAHALAAVLGPGRTKDNPLIVGSVKTNLGHLESAAGVAGLIKVVLSLQHEQIPAHLHFQQMNPHINWGGVPVEIPVAARPWARGEKKRVAGVSAFGFSGTNAHVIVEEAPARSEQPRETERPLHILALSGRTEMALRELADRYAEELGHTEAQLGDICYTTNAGRAHFEHRMAVMGGTVEEVRRRLEETKAGQEITERGGLRPVFLFSGQGSQYPGMGKQLYDTQVVFRKAIEQCEELLQGEMEKPLREVLWGNATHLLQQTEYTQPALFAVEYALSEVWKSWGIAPGVVLGHSVGEYVAACVAGVYSLADGLKLIAARGRLMQGVSGQGAMAAVMASEERVREALQGLSGQVSLAAVNAPESVVISGYEDGVEIAEERLKKAGVRVERLRVSHGFHSPQMTEMEQAFEAIAGAIEYATPRVKLISSVTGKELGRGDIHGAYWRRQVREPVRFQAAIQGLKQSGQHVYVEVGPGSTLLGLGRQCMEGQDGAGKPERMWAVSVRKGRGDWEQMLESLGRLYERGAEVDWDGFDSGYARHRVALPTYPFQRQSYWIENAMRRPAQTPTNAQNSLAGPRESEAGIVPDDWYYKLIWEIKPHRSVPLGGGETAHASHLAQNLDRRAAELQLEQGFDRYAVMRPELNAICVAYIYEALRLTGWQFPISAVITTAQLVNNCAVTAKHRMLFVRLLEILAEAGVLSRQDGETWTVMRAIAPSEPDLQMRALQARYPEFSAELEMTARCAESLAGVLQGKTDPLGLLFPGGSTENAEKIYSDSPSPRVFNGLVSEVVAAEVQSRPEGIIRVLEIGAGTGGTTVHVAPILPPERTEYVYTDVSSSFKGKAANKFKNYPFFSYQTLDIEREPAEQGFEASKFDIIVAANVLHATADLSQTLGHIRSLLSPQGVVVLLEGTYPERWVDLTFGLTDGWWKFRDRELRPSYPLLSRQKWLDLLRDSGFSNCSAVQLPDAHQVVFYARNPAVTASPKGWLIIPDRRGLATDLASRLREQGDTVDLVNLNESINGYFRMNVYDFVLHMSSLDSLESDGSDAEVLFANQSSLLSNVLETTQGMLSEKSAARLWVITSGSQPITASERTLNLAQTPVWGFCKTIAIEQPGLWGGLIDLDPSSSPQEAVAQLSTAVLQNDGEDQIAIRNGRRYLARLARRAPLFGPQPRFSPEKVYLITGGLGELGLKLARWMIERGARRLVLASRGGMPERSTWDSISPESKTGKRVAAIRLLELLGAEIRTPMLDVCDVRKVEDLFATFQPGELKGILHLAAALDGSFVKDMSAASLFSVLGPKTKGTWILHTLSKSLTLDFFVMFSSWASVLGARRLAHYTAANHFLDVFAHYRKGVGLPALTVNWASWDDMHASPEIQQEYTRGGLRPMPSDLALTALGRALAINDPQLIVAAVDWSVHKPLYESQRKRPILERFSEHPDKTTAHFQREDPRRLHMALQDRSPEEREMILIPYLCRALAPILGIDVTNIDSKRSVTDFGLDSLMALEFKNRIGADLNVTIPTVRMLQGPSLEALARQIGLECPSTGPSGSSISSSGNQDRPTTRVLEELCSASLQHRHARLLGYLAEALAPILGIATSAINPMLSVTDFGLDSLMALEFKNRISSDLGVSLPTVCILQGPSLDQLSSQIEKQLPEMPTRESHAGSALSSEKVEYSLSYGQQAQWFGHELMPDSTTFNIAFTSKAYPHLDWDSFQRAVDNLATRHPSLRTIFFVNDEGQPVQQMLPTVRPETVVIDASTWDDAELKKRVINDFGYKFDLSHSLLRVTVYRRSDCDVILFNVHHMIVDAWSLRICFEDLKKLYTAELKGIPADLEPLTAEYHDFVTWQTEMVQGRESERLWNYWKEKLSGELTPLKLPSSLPRPAVLLVRGESIPLALGPELSSSIRQMARQYKATGYSFLLAAFQALLHQFTGQNDIIVGTSASGRDNPKWSNVIGYFVNLLPMRADLSGNPTFAEHLIRTRDNVLSALEHEAFPFPLMVERLRLRRDLSRAPVFQAFFNFLTDRSGELGPLSMGAVDCAIEFGTSTLRPCIIIPQQEGQSEIVLQLAEFEGQIVGNINYNSDVLDRETAQSMVTAFCGILKAVVRNPNTPVGELVPRNTGADSTREEIVL